MRSAAARGAPALAVAVLLALAACSPMGPAPPPAAAGVTPLPASPQPLQPDPARAALTAVQAGLPLRSAGDGLSAEQAAADAPDQPRALALYDSWGWLTESRRTFGGGTRTVDLTLLLTQGPDAASAAYADWAGQAAAAPLAAGICPPAVAADACTLGTAPGRQVAVARVGAEVFSITGGGVAVAPLAALQAAALRPSG